MNFSIQPTLVHEIVKAVPLKSEDFEQLYKVAADSTIWAGHPNKNRHEKVVFQNFFTGAIESKGAFLILDTKTNEVIGSTRFYNYDEKEKSIFIGYTFYAVKYWGKGYNQVVKKMMLDYIFQYVNKVLFHVGAENYQSQRAMEKLGAKKTKVVEVAYFGEPNRMNFEYEIKKTDWEKS